MGDLTPNPLVLKLILAAAALLVCLGCDRHGDDAAATSAAQRREAKQDRATVFATVYALADVTRQIGGRWVNVEWAVEHGQTLDDFTPPPDMRARLNLAELLITGGAANESWAIDTGAGAGSVKIGRLVRMPAPDTVPQAGRSSQAGGDDDEQSARFDAIGQPWLDPIAVRAFADTIARRLAALRPLGEADFRRNAAALQRDINTIVVESRGKLGDVAHKRVLVLSGDFNALLARYGVDPVQVVNEPSALRLTPDEISSLRNAAQTNHIQTLLLEAGTPRAVADDIGSRVGVDVVLIDSYGSSAATSGASTYQELLRYNLAQLAKIK